MPTTQSFNRSIGGGIGAIAVVSLLSSAALLTTANQLHTAIQAREHSHAIVHELDASGPRCSTRKQACAAIS